MACLVLLGGAAVGGMAPAGAVAPHQVDGAVEAQGRGLPRYAEAGPFAVGVTTLELDDREIEVWYPATRRSVRGRDPAEYSLREALPAAVAAQIPDDQALPTRTSAYRDVDTSPRGPFPLVLFSHGSPGYRNVSTFLTTHLASWGFVVAAPDFLERGVRATLGDPPAVPRTDLETFAATIKAVRAAGRDADGVLSGVVKGGDIGVVGQSGGGVAAMELAATDDRVVTFVALAAPAPAPGSARPDVPGLFIAGREDRRVPLEEILGTYRGAAGPKRLVVISGSGHANAFTDGCASDNSIVFPALVIDPGAFPANIGQYEADGCAPPALPPREVQPVTAHYTTAQIRFELGVDDRPVGLARASAQRFGDVGVEYRHERQEQP